MMAYSIPQIQPDAAPDVWQKTPIQAISGVSPFLSSAIGITGNAMAQHQALKDKEDALANTARVMALDTEVSKTVQDLKDQAAQLKGDNVFKFGKDQEGRDQDLLTTQEKALESFIASKTETLANDEQKRMFAESADRARLDLHGYVQAHQSQQAQQWMADTWEKGSEMAAQAAAQAAQQGDMAAIYNQLAKSRFLAKMAANQAGQTSPDQLSIIEQSFTSPVHQQVLSSLINGDKADEANEYFKLNRNQMTPQAAASMEKILKGATSTMQANKAVDSVYDPNANYSDMAATIRRQFENQPETQQKALLFLSERDNEYKRSVNDIATRNTGTLWKGVLGGHGAGWVAAQPEFKAMDGTAQKNLLSQITSFQREQAQGEDSLSHFAAYWALVSNPQALAGMSDQAIFAKAPNLGLQGVKAVLQEKQKLLAAPDAVLASNVDMNQLQLKASGAGLSAYGTSEDDKQVMGSLKYQVDMQIEADQAAKKRQLTRAEKDEIIDRNLMQYQVNTPRGWYNPARWFGDSSSPEAMLDFQIPQGAQVLGPVVPDADREQIIQAFKAQGRTPTDQEIGQAYLLHRSRPPTLVPTFRRPVVPGIRVK